ncbi:MAG: phage tail tape measure protein, partial [Acidobacteria bacterium]|nr:phage tail tape measure protein [Acidobacteriota bacterium]
MSINAGDVVIRFLGDPTSLKRTVGGIESEAKKAGKGAAAGMKPMSAALRGIIKLAGAVGAAFLAWKAVSIFKNMVKAASNFQAEMNKVKALTGAVGKQFDQLREQAMKLGKTTQFSASEAAAGMAFLAQAGFDANQIVKAMPATLDLAAAANIGLAEAADIVSNVMSGMGIAVEDLGGTVDIMTAAFTSANTDLTQLGQAMKFAGPVASDFGLSIAETAGALSLLGNAGIQASMAGTSLRNILNRLVKDGETFGINSFDSLGKMKR